MLLSLILLTLVQFNQDTKATAVYPELPVVATLERAEIPTERFETGVLTLRVLAVGQSLQSVTAPLFVSATAYRAGRNDRIVLQLTNLQAGDRVTPVRGRIFTITVPSRHGPRRYLPIEGGAELRLDDVNDLAQDVEVRLGIELTPDLSRALHGAVPDVLQKIAPATHYLPPPTAKAVGWIELATTAPLEVVQQANTLLDDERLPIGDRLAIHVAVGDALLRLGRPAEARRAYEAAAEIVQQHVVPGEIRVDVADRLFQTRLLLDPTGALRRDEDGERTDSALGGWLRRYLTSRGNFSR